MYEKLDKLREEVRRCERRFADAQSKLKAAQEKLREGEASQILSDVGALKLTPEQLAQVLSLVKSGQLGSVPGVGADGVPASASDDVSNSDPTEDSGASAEQANVGDSNWRDAAEEDSFASDEEDAYGNVSDKTDYA